MKKIILLAVLLLFAAGLFAPAHAWNDRKGHFRLGGFFPGLYVGSKYVDAMMSIGLEGEYFFLDDLAATFRFQEATDFSFGLPPHSILSFTAGAMYVFDIGNSGQWAAYLQAGLGGGLIGDSAGFVDIALPGGGFWYEWYKDWFVGMDASLHILARNPTAVGFNITPSIRYQF